VPTKDESALRSLLSIVIDRTVALATVLGVGFLLLVSLAVNAAISAIGQRYKWWLPTSELLLQIVDFTITYTVIALLFAVMYKMLPDLHIEWSDVIPGALLTSLLFSLGKSLIGMYLGKAGVGSTYGAAGSLVVVLVWVYYSGQIFYLGAEFTQVYAQRHGSRPCDRLAKQMKLTTPAADKPDNEPLLKLS
jgi:membrane protein